MYEGIGRASHDNFVPEAMRDHFRKKPTKEDLIHIREQQTRCQQRLEFLYAINSSNDATRTVERDIDTRKTQQAAEEWALLYNASMNFHLMSDKEFRLWQIKNGVSDQTPTTPGVGVTTEVVDYREKQPPKDDLWMDAIREEAEDAVKKSSDFERTIR